MNSQFITNKDNVLSDIINAILPKCEMCIRDRIMRTSVNIS